MPPRHAALSARLMRPRRAAWPPAAPGGSARSTIGAVAHRGEDLPDDRGIAADSVRRGVIIWRPASRGRFGGLAFNDLDDVEGSHVRHDPPSLLARSCREPLPPPRHLGPHVARPGGQLPAMAQGGSFPPIGAEPAMRMQIPDWAFALSGTAAPRTRRTADRARRRVARGDDRQGAVDARHHVKWWSRSERTRADPPIWALC